MHDQVLKDAAASIESACTIYTVDKREVQRDPEVFLGQVVFWRPGAPRPARPHIFKKRVFLLALAPQASKKPLSAETKPTRMADHRYGSNRSPDPPLWDFPGLRNVGGWV